MFSSRLLVSYSLRVSSLQRVATWSPVREEKTQLDRDLEWPTSWETGDIRARPEPADLRSNIEQLPLLVPVRKYWVWRGWTDTDLGWILSQSLQVVTGLSQPTLLSTITTLPRSPWQNVTLIFFIRNFLKSKIRNSYKSSRVRKFLKS